MDGSGLDLAFPASGKWTKGIRSNMAPRGQRSKSAKRQPDRARRRRSSDGIGDQTDLYVGSQREFERVFGRTIAPNVGIKGERKPNPLGI